MKFKCNLYIALLFTKYGNTTYNELSAQQILSVHLLHFYLKFLLSKLVTRKFSGLNWD